MAIQRPVPLDRFAALAMTNQYLRFDLFKFQLHMRLMNAFAALPDPTRQQIVEMLAAG